MNETIYLSSNYNISISESDHPDYYLVDFILCDFDFNPFNDEQIISSSADLTIMVYFI